ncbi:MAG: hypothetical protein IJ728_04995 [Selenomonadaceae bacterium]|nr:hypothetical protein [Selenomonadaceae bacterium]
MVVKDKNIPLAAQIKSAEDAAYNSITDKDFGFKTFKNAEWLKELKLVNRVEGEAGYERG